MTAALAKIHIAKKELRLHDDDYRAILERETGQSTAKGLSDAQAGRVLEAFRRLGWKPTVVGGSKSPPSGQPAGFPPTQASGGYKARPADHETAKKARALWISLWQLGAIRDKSEAALEAFARRQLKCERLVWANQQQTYKLIEALKAIGRRHGWLQDEAGLHGVHALKALKRQLVEAQCKKLGRVCPPLDLKSLEQLTDLAADFGHAIRKAMD